MIAGGGQNKLTQQINVDKKAEKGSFFSYSETLRKHDHNLKKFCVNVIILSCNKIICSLMELNLLVFQGQLDF